MFNMQEPSADARIAARAIWDMYSSLVQQGFTEVQALEIIKVWVAGANK